MAHPDEKASTCDLKITSELKSSKIYPKWMFWKKQRYVVASLAFLGFFNVYALRANLSIAIVAMTDNRILSNGTIIGPEFDWNSNQKGLVLSSFFYGYITTQLFGGWLSARIGGKRVFGGGVAVTAALTLLTPVLARTDFSCLLVVRIIEGIFEGVTYPCIHAVWSRWAPPLERSKLATIGFSGSYVGTVVSMPLSAYLAQELEWPSIFYFFGALALIWCAVWWYFVAESPEDDPRISKEELDYIRKCLGNISAKREIAHPWKEILTSMPVWAIVVSHFCDNWGFYTLLTQMPMFLKDSFHFDLDKTGLLAALPYLAMAIMIQFSGHLADWLREKRILSTTAVRKIFNCGAFIIHIIFMLIAVYWLEQIPTITALTLAVGLGVFSWSGFGVNYLDIAPQHASVIMGISNTVGTLAGIFTPIVTGFIVVSSKHEQWETVFIIASGVFLFGAIFYGIFASGDVQPWAVQPENNDRKEVNFKNETEIEKGQDNEAYTPTLEERRSIQSDNENF